jgi:hypothetical protein
MCQLDAMAQPLHVHTPPHGAPASFFWTGLQALNHLKIYYADIYCNPLSAFQCFSSRTNLVH